MAKWVYHATHKDFVGRVHYEGFLVGKHGSKAIYGRGIYFWDLQHDAQTYGYLRFRRDAATVKAHIEVSASNSVVWNSRYRGEEPDTIARNLIRRGIEVLVIPNHLIEETTMGAATGDAYCYLVDLGSSSASVASPDHVRVPMEPFRTWRTVEFSVRIRQRRGHYYAQARETPYPSNGGERYSAVGNTADEAQSKLIAILKAKRIVDSPWRWSWASDSLPDSAWDW